MWQIARNEILLNLLSLRFALGMSIAVCMMDIVGLRFMRQDVTMGGVA